MQTKPAWTGSLQLLPGLPKAGPTNPSTAAALAPLPGLPGLPVATPTKTSSDGLLPPLPGLPGLPVATPTKTSDDVPAPLPTQTAGNDPTDPTGLVPPLP